MKHTALRALVLVVALEGCGRFRFDALPGASDATGGDATDSGAAPMGCNAITRFADDFADGVDAGEHWKSSYADPGTSYAEVAGEVILTPATGISGSYAGYKTLRAYDLRGHRAFAKNTQLANAGVQNGISVEDDAGDFLHVVVASGSLSAVTNVNSVFTTIASSAYDAAQVYWGIEERSGTILFETSADGVTFTTFAQTPSPFDMSLVKFTMFVGSGGSVASPGTAHFTAYNGGVADGEAACAASTLSDRFDGSARAPTWGNGYDDTACCTQMQAGGTVTLGSNGQLGYTAYRTLAGYSLTNDQVNVTIPSGPAAASTFYGDLHIIVDTNNTLSLQVTATQWKPGSTVAGTQTLSPVARQLGENYIRIRDSSGMVNFEASTDKVAWRSLLVLPEPFAVDDVLVALEAGIAG